MSLTSYRAAPPRGGVVLAFWPDGWVRRGTRFVSACLARGVVVRAAIARCGFPSERELPFLEYWNGFEWCVFVKVLWVRLEDLAATYSSVS